MSCFSTDKAPTDEVNPLFTVIAPVLVLVIFVLLIVMILFTWGAIDKERKRLKIIERGKNNA